MLCEDNKVREIHFYRSADDVPNAMSFHYYAGWKDTLDAINDKDENFIATTQMGLLSTTLLVKGFRIFIHDNHYETYEIKLGSDNERTNREVKVSHNLFVMWKQGEFDAQVKTNDVVSVDRVVDIIYPLLDEYDIGVWEDISYVYLANAYVDIIHSEEYRKLVASDVNVDLDGYIKGKLKEFFVNDTGTPYEKK